MHEKGVRETIDDEAWGYKVSGKREDKLVLKFDEHEKFSIKKLSKLLGDLPSHGVDETLMWAWKFKVPLKVQYFLWFAYLGRIPIKKFLVSKGLNLGKNK